jgi:hypothetical protein
VQAAADRRGQWTLQRDAMMRDGIDRLRQQFTGLRLRG